MPNTQSTHTGYSRIHGGAPDARWDYSNNSNCLGPCPDALQAIAAADLSNYPDASYQSLIALLAQWHGVAAPRVMLGASASELIMRFNLALRLMGSGNSQGQAWRIAIPQLAYGDYACSAIACGHTLCVAHEEADLTWITLPGSPLGQLSTMASASPNMLQVVDCAYLPLQLSGEQASAAALNNAWQIWSPNKALGLCGVRGAYAIAPQVVPARFAGLLQTLRSLEPSWVLGAASVALLQSWTSQPVQEWLVASRDRLRTLKAAQIAQTQRLQIAVQPSTTNFVCVQLHARPAEHQRRLLALCQHGVALRDTTSMGLPGWARMRVHTPQALDAFIQAWTKL